MTCMFQRRTQIITHYHYSVLGTTTTVTYYGLYDIEGATEDDVLLVESYASLNTHVGYKHRMDLLPLQTVPVCGMVQQDENGNNIYSSVSNWYKNNFNNNQNAVCPQDGQYPFEASFQFQAPKSRFLSWLATGYHGEAVVDIYMQRTMDLVGRCHLPIKTKPTLPLVSGMIAMTSLFVMSLVGLTYLILWGRKGGRSGGYRCLGTKENEESLLPNEDDYVTAMDEFGVKMETARKQHKRTPQDLVAW